MFNKTWRSFILVAGETALLVAAVVISSIVIGGSVAVIVSLMFPSTQVAALHRDRKWR